MRLLLTPKILNYLIRQGFRYCYSRTSLAKAGINAVVIMLTPVRSRPRLKKLPLQYDTFFTMSKEPAQMAKGIDDTLVYVNIDEETMNGYLKSMLEVLYKPTGNIIHMTVKSN